MTVPTAARWALLIGLTAAVTAGMAALAVPSPALFAGLLVATALAPSGVPWWHGVVLLLVCAGTGVPTARLARMPAGALLGPMVVAIVANLAGIAGAASVPAAVVEIAYAVIGWQAGARFTRASLRVVI